MYIHVVTYGQFTSTNQASPLNLIVVPGSKSTYPVRPEIDALPH